MSITPRFKVLCVVDRPGGVLERRCRALARYLGDEFDFEFSSEGHGSGGAEADIVYLADHRLALPVGLPSRSRRISAVLSPAALEEHEVSMLAGTIQAVTRQLTSDLSRRCPRVAYVSHGVDTSYFLPATQPHYTGHNLRLGWIGDPRNQRSGFAEIVARLGSLAGVELHLAGFGEKQIPFSDMPAFYDGIEALLKVETGTGQSDSLLEAGAMGRAVIAVPEGGHAEYLRHGENALVVSRDLTSIVDAIMLLRDAPDLRSILGGKLRQTICEQWDWRVRAEDFRKMFHQVITS